MLRALNDVWALFIGIALFMLGNGLQGTLLGLRASMEGFGTAVTGVVMSGYFIGLLAGSLLTPVLIARVGHIRVFAAYASVASTMFLLFVVFIDPIVWFVMRIMTGTCLAGLYVVSESWLNHAATNETRGKVLSVYMIVAFAAFGLGQLLLNLSDPGGFVLFIVVSALVSLALVPVSLANISAPPVQAPRSVSIADIYRTSPLAVVACFANGIAQGAFFGMGAVYASLLGLSFAQISILMSLPILGVVFAQYPVGWLSDLFDRRTVMMVMAFVTAAAGVACLFAPAISFIALAVAFTVFGALSLPLYSLAIAHANDHLDHDQMLGASATLVLIYGLGSSFGPIIVGGAMRETGPAGFFVYMIAVYAALGAFAAYRMVRRPSVPGADQGEFVLMAPRATAVAAAAIAEDWDDGSPRPGADGDGTPDP
jgi:MFS family permease